MKLPILFFELNEDKLYQWLSDPSETEGWEYDFKENLPHKSDKGNKLHLIATFCAFSNTHGGFLLYGIDKNRVVKGLPLDGDFKKKLNDLVGKYIRPPLQNNWDLIRQFELANKFPGQYIYVVHIPESVIYHKPHVCTYEGDNRIYRRGNTSNFSLDDGRDIRSEFFDKRFSPYCFETLDKLFDEMKKVGFAKGYIETLFLLELKQYLKGRGEKEASFLGLLAILDSIIEKIKTIAEMNDPQKNASWDELSTTGADVEKEKVNEELKVIIDKFIKEYKEMHGLKI